jgi:hypothetical protein
MGNDKREETSPRETQKVGENDTHKRREVEREGAWACACHTALFFFFFFSSVAVCLSVWGFLCPLKTSSLSLLSLQKSFCLSHYLQFATSNPKKRKKKKNRKKKLLQKFCSQSEVL